MRCGRAALARSSARRDGSGRDAIRWQPRRSGTESRLCSHRQAPLSSLRLPWAQPSQADHTGCPRQAPIPAVSANGSPQGAEIPSRRKVRQVKNLSILQGETVLPTYDFRYASRWTGTLLDCRQENARLPLNVYFSHKYNIALLEASVFLVLRFCPGERPITKTIHSPHRARNRLASHFDSAMRRGSALSGGRGDGCHLECVLTQCVFDANAPPEPILLCTKKKFSPSILTGRKRRKPIKAFINMILTR